MSHEASAWAWENSQAKGVGRFILLAIADKAPASTCQAYASLSWLQDMANAGRPAVVKGLKDVLASGELELVEGETGPFGAAVYRLPKALGYVPGSTRSVRKQNRSAEAVSGSDGSQGQAIGSETEPIMPPDDDPSGVGGGEIGSETEPRGSETEPIQGGSETEPIEEIGSQTEPIAEEPNGQSVLFDAPIGSVRQPLHKNTTTTTKSIDGASTSTAATSNRSSSKPEKRDDKIPLQPEAFAAFWKAYPKKVCKGPAIKSWNAAIDKEIEPAVIVAGAEAYRASPYRNKRYTRNPATWLNDDGWDEETEPLGPEPGDGPTPYRNDPNKDFGRGFPGTVTTYEGN